MQENESFLSCSVLSSSFRCRSSQMQLQNYSFSGVHPSVFLYFLIPFLNNKIPERIIIGSNLYANKQCQDDSRSCSEKIFFLFFISMFFFLVFCGSFQAKEHEKKVMRTLSLLIRIYCFFYCLLACLLFSQSFSINFPCVSGIPYESDTEAGAKSRKHGMK